MGILDKFKKKKESSAANPLDPQNMGMLQRIAYKKIMKMNPSEREALMRKMLSPDNIQKNKKQIVEMLEQMEKSGQMNRHQVFEAKKRLGLL
ncbi:MAG TPA: hypothetical protein PKA31_00185 [Candidatus Moranbacteria bacterium]|nr:hypothetical protein [Candidatus Moranbacteria bacterium]